MNVEEIKIRRADPKDIPAIVAHNQNAAKEMEGKAIDSNILTQGVELICKSGNENLGFYVVAQVENKIVASLRIFYEWSPWRNATFWWIQNVFVIKEWRHKGIYSKMHSYLLEKIQTDPNVCGLRLFTDIENIPAQKAYTKANMNPEKSILFEVDLIYGKDYV